MRRPRQLRPRPWDAAGRMVVLLACLASPAAAACQQNACNGEPFAPKPSTPLIHNIAVRQPLIDSNPWHLVLDLDFEDTGADLGGGTAFVHLFGSPQVSRSFALDTYFRASEVPLDATDGTVALYMTLPPNAFGDATTVQMDVQLEDASRPDPEGLFSNCYRMNLEFQVAPLARAAARVAGELGDGLADWGRRTAGAWSRVAAAEGASLGDAATPR